MRGTRAAQGLSSLELANSLDLELDKQQSLLITSIRELGSGFQSTTVLLNNVLHTVGQDSSPLVTAQPPQPLVCSVASEELILWVRPQLYMKNYLEINPNFNDFFLLFER